MPEGPEVKIVANQLDAKFKDQTLVKINILSGPYATKSEDRYKLFRLATKKFSKAQLTSVQTKGKTMYWELTPSSGKNVVTKEYIIIGFGLTGGFTFTKGEHSRIEFIFVDNEGHTTSLYYDDMRNFGNFQLVNRETLNTKLDSLGPDIFTITEDELNEQLTISSIQKHEIVKALLNQKVIAGIGNYLRAEILYAANLDLSTKVQDMNSDQIEALYQAIHKITNEVMEAGGSPNYEDLNKTVGNYKFKVYQKTKTPEGQPVKKTTVSGRTVYHI
jgi:DNA-formamidopyrimidine glycosylase